MIYKTTCLWATIFFLLQFALFAFGLYKFILSAYVCMVMLLIFVCCSLSVVFALAFSFIRRVCRSDSVCVCMFVCSCIFSLCGLRIRTTPFLAISVTYLGSVQTHISRCSDILNILRPIGWVHSIKKGFECGRGVSQRVCVCPIYAIISKSIFSICCHASSDNIQFNLIKYICVLILLQHCVFKNYINRIIFICICDITQFKHTIAESPSIIMSNQHEDLSLAKINLEWKLRAKQTHKHPRTHTHTHTHSADSNHMRATNWIEYIVVRRSIEIHDSRAQMKKSNKLSKEVDEQ